MTESDLQKVYNYYFFPKVFETTTDKGFNNFDDKSIGGTHWKCFYVKYNKSLFVDSFGGPPEEIFPKKYRKQSLFICIEFNVSLVDYVVCIVYGFSI